MKKVKICGLSRPCDIEMVNDLKPDFCGFIINFPKSKRNISVDTLKELVRNLDADVIPVGVFVDQPAELIADLLNSNTLEIAQLHGHEDNDYIADLKKLTKKTIWQAFQIKDECDIMNANGSGADFIIVDSGQGSGKTFDWQFTQRINRPYGLAGGLDIDNVNMALNTNSRLLDVSGGVETDGFKDANKVREFIASVRSVD